MTPKSDGFFGFLTPAEIYHQLTQGAGVGPLSDVQQTLHWEAPEEENRATLIASIGELIATGWQGTAGAAAQDAALPLRDHVLANADKLDRAQDLLSRQVGSFETAYNSVLPVPDVPQQRLDEPVPFDVDHAKEVALYQVVAQHNIDVFGQYDGASEYNETNMPQEFHAGGRDGGDVSVRSADAVDVREPRAGDGPPGAGPEDGSWPGGTGDGSRPGGDGARPGGTAGGFGPGGAVDEARPGGAADGTRPGGAAGGFPDGSSSGYPGDSAGETGAGRGVTESSGVLAPGGGQAVANERSVGGNPASGYSPLAGGSGSGGSGPIVGGYSGGGGAPRMSGGALVRGPGGSVGVGALAAEENAARRGVAAAGARGGVGAVGAPLGAGRGKGDEDALHERKVLIEVDSEETFGSDVLTAPPVIGDDEFED